jgi:hypothetical protein
MKKIIFTFAFILSVMLSVTVSARPQITMNSLINSAKDFTVKDFKENSKIESILMSKKRVDVGPSFLNDVLKHNDRLDYYDLYLKLAKDEGYIITSYSDYIENYKNTNQKVLILRHDIDETNAGDREIFEVEKRNHVKATYYFRWSTFDKSFIDDLNAAGFEVGLHYETIATYCDKYNIKTLTKDDINKCREILKQEIIDFKNKSGINIKTVSSHGAETNIRLKIPNKILFYGQNYADYGIISETYDKDIIKNYITAYICDEHLYKNFGFEYSENPIHAIMNGDKVIEFLAHPNHWNFSPTERDHMLKTISYK